jgi:hypothetical protein
MFPTTRALSQVVSSRAICPSPALPHTVRPRARARFYLSLRAGRCDDERAQLHFGSGGAWRWAEHSGAEHARAVGAVDAEGVAHEDGLVVHRGDDLREHAAERGG